MTSADQRKKKTTEIAREGGDRAIAEREKARTEAHSSSCLLQPLLPVNPSQSLFHDRLDQGYPASRHLPTLPTQAPINLSDRSTLRVSNRRRNRRKRCIAPVTTDIISDADSINALIHTIPWASYNGNLDGPNGVTRALVNVPALTTRTFGEGHLKYSISRQTERLAQCAYSSYQCSAEVLCG